MSKRVVVCGSNYGARYLHALSQVPDRYEVVGLLARGSDRSRQVAERAGVPLVRNVRELPEADLACAALGADGHAVVIELLDRGFSVLCEHPLGREQVEASLAAAERSGARFHVNGHWSDLAPARRFIEQAQRDKLAHLQVDLSDRMLYGGLDILRRAFGSLEPALEIEGRCDDFVRLYGRMCAVSCALRIESSRRKEGAVLADGSESYRLSHRLIAELDAGALAPLGPAGPVVWNANEYRSEDLDQGLWRTFDDSPHTLRSLGGERVAANLHSLDLLSLDVDEGRVPAEQEPEGLLALAGAWETIGRHLTD